MAWAWRRAALVASAMRRPGPAAAPPRPQAGPGHGGVDGDVGDGHPAIDGDTDGAGAGLAGGAHLAEAGLDAVTGGAEGFLVAHEAGDGAGGLEGVEHGAGSLGGREQSKPSARG